MKYIHYRRCEEDEAEFRAAIADVEPQQFIFLDEMHVSRKDLRRHKGWAKKGKRAVAKGITVGKNRFNITAAFTLQGFVAWDIAYQKSSKEGGLEDWDPDRGAANISIDDEGRNTQLKFAMFLGDVLAGNSVIQPHPADRSVLVFDNASVHSIPEVIAEIEALGVIVFNTP